jgi:protein O-GlcNAc transferase
MSHSNCIRFARRVTPCLVVWCLATSLAAGESKQEQLKSADVAFRAGYAAEKTGDLGTARQQFEKVVQLAPKIAEGHSALGSVLLQLGDYGAASRELLRALDLKPGDRTSGINLAVAYEQSGNHERASALFRTLDGTGSPLPESVVIFYIRALAATHQTESALAKARNAVTAFPQNPGLHDVLGSLEAQRQSWSEAEDEFKESILLDPNFGDAHLHLGLALMIQGLASDAVQELAIASRLSPQSIPTQVELAKALIAAGDTAQAVNVLQQALAKDPSSLDSKYQLALAFQSNGEERRAIPLFEEVVATDPLNAQALTNLGLALVQTGKSKDAVPLYQRALKITPTDPLIYQDLGVAYLQESNLDDAIAEFHAGLRLAHEAYELHYDLGLALKLKDDLPAAASELETAARLNPESPDPPFTLGILDMQRGRFDDAAQQLSTALRLRPENGDGWATLGSVYKQQGKFLEASDALRKAIELMPNQPGPHITLAGVLMQQGQASEAAAERKKAAEISRMAVNRQRATFATNAGNALLSKGAVAEAIERFQEAVSIDPMYMDGHRGLVAALERAGRNAEAQGETQKLHQLEPNTLKGTSQ